MNVNDKIWNEIIKAFDNLGADTELLCNIGSINDTLSDDEILQNLIDYNNGLRMTIIEEFDAGILKDAEQASKRNFHKSKVAQNSTSNNTESRAIALLNKLDMGWPTKYGSQDDKFVQLIIDEWRSAKADVS